MGQKDIASSIVEAINHLSLALEAVGMQRPVRVEIAQNDYAALQSILTAGPWVVEDPSLDGRTTILGVEIVASPAQSVDGPARAEIISDLRMTFEDAGVKPAHSLGFAEVMFGRIRALASPASQASTQPVRDMLAAAAAQFEFYSDQHSAKGTEDGAAKAETNRVFAARCRAALAVPAPQPNPLDVRIAVLIEDAFRAGFDTALCNEDGVDTLDDFWESYRSNLATQPQHKEGAPQPASDDVPTIPATLTRDQVASVCRVWNMHAPDVQRIWPTIRTALRKDMAAGDNAAAVLRLLDASERVSVRDGLRKAANAYREDAGTFEAYGQRGWQGDADGQMREAAICDEIADLIDQDQVVRSTFAISVGRGVEAQSLRRDTLILDYLIRNGVVISRGRPHVLPDEHLPVTDERSSEHGVRSQMIREINMATSDLATALGKPPGSIPGIWKR